MIPSLLDLTRKARGERPDAADEVVIAVATLAQAAYEDCEENPDLDCVPDPGSVFRTARRYLTILEYPAS
jgi:hypothetical protein